MYSYGQFCRTPIGRMRVRKASDLSQACIKCKLGMISCWTNAELFDFCLHKLPKDAYL